MIDLSRYKAVAAAEAQEAAERAAYKKWEAACDPIRTENKKRTDCYRSEMRDYGERAAAGELKPGELPPEQPRMLTAPPAPVNIDDLRHYVWKRRRKEALVAHAAEIMAAIEKESQRIEREAAPHRRALDQLNEQAKRLGAQLHDLHSAGAALDTKLNPEAVLPPSPSNRGLLEGRPSVLFDVRESPDQSEDRVVVNILDDSLGRRKLGTR